MRKYYLFVIRKDIREIYVGNEQILFLTLENIYNLKENNIGYGVSIYNQMCKTIDSKVINNYLCNKNKKYIKQYNNKFLINDIYELSKSCIQVNKSCIVIKTNHNFPYVLNIFKWYNNNIFVCDFENKDYFWLNNITNKKDSNIIYNN